MIVKQHTVSQRSEAVQVLFPDVFLCPMCGSVGGFGQTGFTCTERPAWFRCSCCEYVFAFERPRPVIAAEALS